MFKMDLDSVLDDIGGFGRYQKRAYYIINILGTPLSAQMLILIVAGVYPQWTCPEGDETKDCELNKSCCTPDSKMCSGEQFTSHFSSIGTEWNLVCGDLYKNGLAQSIFVSGKMFGSILIGSLADRYGRKKLWLVAYTAGATIAVLSSLAWSFSVYASLRFLTGIFSGGGGLVSFVLCTEIIGPSMRGTASTWSHVFYGLSFPVMALLAFLLQDWRLLTFFSVLPSFLIVFFHHMIPESPRWLASQGRTQEAEEMLRLIARGNGTHPAPAISLNDIRVPDSRVQKYGIRDILTNKSTMIMTVILAVCCSVNGLVYYGMSLNVRNLGGNIYLNFAFFGLVEIPSYFVTSFLISYSGRRRSLFYFMIGAAMASLCCARLQDASINPVYLSVAALIGKFFISASFAVLYVYSAELYPTVVRNTALGVVKLSGKTGGVIAPFVVLLGAGDADQNKSLPMFVFACSTVAASLLGLKLRETLGKKMPETFQDLEKLEESTNYEHFPPQ